MNPHKKEWGYWTEKNVLAELKKLAAKLGHFPRYREMAQVSNALAAHVSHMGGIKKFSPLLGYKMAPGGRGYWTEETIMRELKKLAAKLGYFPRYWEMGQVSKALVEHVVRSGGVKKYCPLLGYERHSRSRGYWTEETVVRVLKKLAASLGHFPSHTERLRASKTLSVRIVRFGGIDKFRRLSGYEIVRD